MQFVVDYVQNVILQGIQVNFSLDARLAAAFTLGADTSFLQGGTLGDSLFIGTGPVFDAAFDLNVSASAPIAAAAGFGLLGYSCPTPGQVFGGAGQVVGDLGNPQQTLGDLQGGYQHAVGELGQLGSQIGKQLVDARNVAESDLQKLVNAAGSVSISLATSGQFMVGVCDPSGANNGKLTFATIAKGGASAISSQQQVTSQPPLARRTVLGVHGHLGINAPGIVSFQSGCVIAAGTNGPGAASQPGPTAAMAAPFAELKGRTLQVYGSSASDKFDIAASGNQLIAPETDITFIRRTILTSSRWTCAAALDRVPAGPPPVDGGDDTVVAEASVPTNIPVEMFGGTGNDSFTLGDGKDFISIESGNNTIVMGNGNDTVVESDPGSTSGDNIVTLGSGQGYDMATAKIPLPAVAGTINSRSARATTP